MRAGIQYSLVAIIALSLNAVADEPKPQPVRTLIEQRGLAHVGLVINNLSSGIARDYYGGNYYGHGEDTLVTSKPRTPVAKVSG